MKTIKYILTLGLAVLFLISCEEKQPPLFGDITGLYFNNKDKGTVVESTSVTFVYEDSDRMDIPVAIQLMGRISDADRNFSIAVSSDNAEEGVDYILPESALFPAGASDFGYVVTLMKTEALKSESKTLYLELRENENFSLPVTELDQASGKVSLVKFRIEFSNRFSEAPASWDKGLLGKFSQQKFELIIKVLGIDRSDFNNPEKMPLSRQAYISAEMTAYVEAQLALYKAGKECDMDIFEDSENPDPDKVLTFKKTDDE